MAGRRKLIPDKVWHEVDWSRPVAAIAADLSQRYAVLIKPDYVYAAARRLHIQRAYRGTGRGFRADWLTVNWERESIADIAARLGVTRSRVSKVRRQHYAAHQ